MHTIEQRPTSGVFITFEGPEGAGKSTQIAHLARALQSAGRVVHQTREPGGTPLGESLRHLLKSQGAGSTLCSEAELLLFAASRAQHVRERIAPHLANGDVVLCDRFLDSSVVYQGFARGLPLDQVRAINTFAICDCVPHLTVLLDIPEAESIRRIRARAGGLDRMEREEESFYGRVRRGYLTLARENPYRIRVFDGMASEESIAQDILNVVRARVGAV